MKKWILSFMMCIGLIVQIHAQNASLFPNATWLQDVHWTGTVYAGISAPVMVDVQAHAGYHGELTFYLKEDEEKARSYIDEIHANGRKYWANIDASGLEGVNAKDIVNDGQGISDTLFGAFVTLEGLVSSVKKSINRPAWRNYLISCIKRSIAAGANGSQHDGAWPPFDSFDDDDVEAFEQYVISNGINTYDWDYNTETFREYLLRKGKTDENVLDTDNDPIEVQELVDDWKSFKAVQSLESWQIVQDSCQAFAQSLGKEYTLAVNAASAFGTRNGLVYLAGDYYIGEFFGWGNYYPLTGSVTARVKMAEAFGKRFICWSSPTLEDIDDGDPNTGYGADIESQAEMILASQLYATGGLPQLKYPSDLSYPVFYLAQTNSDLLNSVSPFGETAVIMSQAQMIQDTRGTEGLIVVLQDINRSLEVKWLKSNLLNLTDDFELSDIQDYKVVFLPEVFYLTDNQKNILLDYMNGGGTVVGVRGNAEYCGQYDENGNENTVADWTTIANQSNSGSFDYGQGRYINIAHNINEPNGYPPPSYGFAYLQDKADPDLNYLAVAIRDTIQKWMDEAITSHEVFSTPLPPYVRFFRYQDSTAHNYLYQVLADSVNLATRQPIPITSFTVELAVSPFSYNRLFNATWYSIDNPEGTEIGTELAVNQSAGRVSITVPAFSRWGFVRLDGSDVETNPLRIGNLAIDGTRQFQRLKSRSVVTGTWEVLSGNPDLFEVEVWTNIRNIGNPVFSNDVSGTIAQTSGISDKEFNDKYLSGATRVMSAQISAANSEYTIPAGALHDSIVYLYRVHAIQNSDTSNWIQRLFYRNAPPGAPHESQIFTASQNLWYYTDNGYSPPDSSYHPVIAFNKAKNYGSDYELDSLLFGFNVYTDSLTGKKGDTLATLHLIGSQFKHKLAWNESMHDARGDIQDTLSFSLEPYENFGIYFHAIATDMIDSSKFSPWFGFYLDNHNDPPNPFHLIEPADYSALEQEVPFKWHNNGDPDPLDKENYTISRVEVLFDSIPSFNSPGLRTYSRDRSGLEFEQDTIVLDLPSNYFHAEGLDTYDVVYWKARMYDFDWHSESGSNVLFTESSEAYIFYLGGTAGSLQTPVLKSPIDHSADLPLDVLLEWNPVPNAEKYALQVAKDANFQNMLLDIPDLKQSNFMLGKLEPGTMYYWHVMAINASAVSQWSALRNFTTVALPDAITLIAPETNVTIPGDSLCLLWHQGFPKVDQYFVEYSSDPSFNSSFIDSSLKDTVFCLSGLEANKSYYWHIKAFNPAGWGPFSETRTFTLDLTTIEENAIPKSFGLSQNFPNPFNPSTHIVFWLPEASDVKIVVFNIMGQRVKTIFNSRKQPGRFEVTIDMSALPSGIYFYRMTAKKFQQTRRMLLLK